MDTLTELEYYCNTPNPVGALMLTGEWGCGKTYLIKHELKEKLKAAHIVVLVSLFGLDSVEAVHLAVKKAWFDEWSDDKGPVGGLLKIISELKNKAGSVVSAATPDGKAKDIVQSVLSLDTLDYLKISNKIGNQSVLLVFDDLERSKLDPVELLGIINDYCENQNFHTIIVANEEKIISGNQFDKGSCAQLLIDGNILDPHQTREQKSEPIPVKAKMALKYAQDNGLSYDEIKEKIVQRTLAYTPNFDTIISSIVDNFESKGKIASTYNSFLKSHIEKLQKLFWVELPDVKPTYSELFETAPKDRNLRTPHNLRSFRCGIQDFERVYVLLNDNDIDNLDKWLVSFMMFEMAVRTGTISEDLLQDKGTTDIYPSYDSRFILNFEKNWILNGEWSDSVAQQEISKYKAQQSAKKPYDMVRLNEIALLEDKDAVEGFPLVLEAGYSGKLDLDEYITLIKNIHFARLYVKDLCAHIDMGKLKDGINKKIQCMTNNGEQDKSERQFISEETLKNYTEDEKELYFIIYKLRDTDHLICASNKKDYIDTMQTDCMMSLGMLRTKRFGAFDEDMAIETAKAFIQCPNASKYVFDSNCRVAWKYWENSPEMCNEVSIRGLERLYNDVSAARESVSDAEPISLWQYNRFLTNIRDVLDKLKKLEKEALKESYTEEQ